MQQQRRVPFFWLRLSASAASAAATYTGRPCCGCYAPLGSDRRQSQSGADPCARRWRRGGWVHHRVAAVAHAWHRGEHRGAAQRGRATELPRGLNLLLNHNGMAALADIDASLEAALRSIGTDTVGWSARMMTGELLYELADVQEEGLADTPGLVGRWDEVNATLQAACGVDQIRFGTAVSSWEYVRPENPGALRVHLEEETVDDSAAAAAQGSGRGGGTRTIVEVNRETGRLMWLLVFVFIESLSR